MQDDSGFVSALTGPVGDIEPRFLHDIDTDRLVGAIVALSAELWILRDRQARIERVLENGGALLPGAVEALTDSPEISRELADAAERFSGRILGELVRDNRPLSSVGGAKRHIGTRNT